MPAPDICFSSRHYPHIEVQKGTELTLEDELGHKEDIQQYIAAKLRLRKTKAAQNLQAKILEKSSLIFLWVVLVIDILNSEYPLKPIDKMLKRLGEIPPKLADLFEMILTRDGENPKLLQVCLQWILFATTPLKPQELYFAVQFGLDEECGTGHWDKETVDLDNMKAFVRHSSKGLAEVTRNKASEVQFIHESVRDFLQGRYSAQWSGTSSDFVGQSHEVLRDCCLAQVNAAANDCCSAQLDAIVWDHNDDIAFVLSQAPGAAQQPLHKVIRAKFPFLEYATLNVLRHANNAQQRGMEQGMFLDRFPLHEWVLVNNTLEKHAIRQYEDNISLRYILAENNLAQLIAVHPQSESCFEVVPNARYGPPIFAALATESHEAVRALLEADVQAQPVESHVSLRNYCNQHFEKQKKGIKFQFGYDFKFSKIKGVLSHLLGLQHDDLVCFLLSTCQVDINHRDREGFTPLSYAARRGCEPMVKLLLEKGARDDSIALLHATAGGHESIVKTLVENGAIIEDDATLRIAVQEGHEGMVKLLLERGVGTEQPASYDLTPLQLAVRGGHEAIVGMLLDNGVETELHPKNVNDWTPLQLAVILGRKRIVEMLLEKGAKTEPKGKPGHAALHLAIKRGDEEIVEILVKKGAKIDQSVLSLARERGNEEMVELLLQNRVRDD